MFAKSECFSVTQPPELETESSSKYVYLRKDFSFMPEHMDEVSGEIIPAKWEYMETKIPKDVYDLVLMYKSAEAQTSSNTEDIQLIKDAICELSMIGA